jgi:hypothetical protein
MYFQNSDVISSAPAILFLRAAMMFLKRSKMSFNTAMMVHKAVPSAQQCCSFSTAMMFLSK